MERKVKVKMPDGREVDATVVDITSSQETWNQYLLADNTILKTKAVTMECYRVDGEYDPEGNPLYMLKGTSIMSAQVPDAMKKKA